MKLQIRSGQVRSVPPRVAKDWTVWKKSSLLGKFGVAELSLTKHVSDFCSLGSEIRETAKEEFGGRWYRGAGFGTVIRIPEIAGEPMKIFEQIDMRNRMDGNLWQWILLVFERERAVVGLHMWYHGYLHPVFLEISQAFSDAEYEVITTDTEIDPLAAKLMKMNKALKPFKWLDAFVN